MQNKRLPTKPSAPATTERDSKALDVRVRRSRATVLGAAAELLLERGFSGVSVDEITRRSDYVQHSFLRRQSTS
jgi:AcrR family transcriptional regulator